MKSLKFVLSAAAAVLFAGAVVAQDLTPNDVIAKYNEGADQYTAKDYVKAAATFEAAVEMGETVEGAEETVQNAKNLIPICYYQMGMANARNKKLDEAAKNFQDAIAKSQMYSNIEYLSKAKDMLGKVYSIQATEAFNNKDFAKAIEIFKAAYTANPKDTKSGLFLAMSLCENGQMEEGLKIYGEIIALGENPKYAEAAQEARDKAAGYILHDAVEAAKNKEYTKVYELTDKALEIDPSNAEAYMLDMQTANNTKNYDRVIKLGEAAATAQVTPEMKSTAYFFLATAYDNKENKDKALEMYRKVVAGQYVATAKAQVAALSK